MKCLTCKHFSFEFTEQHVWSEVTIDYGTFHITCMQQHFDRDTESTDTEELYNLLRCGETCEDHETVKNICKHCGHRGHIDSLWCTACKKRF